MSFFRVTNSGVTDRIVSANVNPLMTGRRTRDLHVGEVNDGKQTKGPQRTEWTGRGRGWRGTEWAGLWSKGLGKSRDLDGSATDSNAA